LGKWFSIDPLSFVQSSWSPYHFGFNSNPITNIDVDGLIPYPITIRSFAPFEYFGGGFHGDNRGYSLNEKASARVHQKIYFDTDKSMLPIDCFSDLSWHYLNPSNRKTATPNCGLEYFIIKKSGDIKEFSFKTYYSASNPL